MNLFGNLGGGDLQAQMSQVQQVSMSRKYLYTTLLNAHDDPLPTTGVPSWSSEPFCSALTRVLVLWLQQLLNNPELFQQMMESPMMQNLMSNPDSLQRLLTSNPQIQRLMEVGTHPLASLF